MSKLVTKVIDGKKLFITCGEPYSVKKRCIWALGFGSIPTSLFRKLQHLLQKLRDTGKFFTLLGGQAKLLEKYA